MKWTASWTVDMAVFFLGGSWKVPSRDADDREQRPINLNLWRDSGDVENTQKEKSHWDIKKVSITGTILYLFFRTQDGKRIYFLISLAMKKVLYLFLQKGQIQR